MFENRYGRMFRITQDKLQSKKWQVLDRQITRGLSFVKISSQENSSTIKQASTLHERLAYFLTKGLCLIQMH